MKVWTCNNFEGHWPVGAAAVMVAETADEAKMVLLSELKTRGLGEQCLESLHVKEIDIGKPAAFILCDGDY